MTMVGETRLKMYKTRLASYKTRLGSYLGSGWLRIRLPARFFRRLVDNDSHFPGVVRLYYF
jgi:hypothetical protein